MTTCVGRRSRLDEPLRAAAAAHGGDGGRASRAAGTDGATASGQRRAGRSACRAGHVGQQVGASTPTASADQLLGRQLAGSTGGRPKRRVRSGQASGTSTSPRPGEAVAEHQVGQAGTAAGPARLSRRTSSRWAASGDGDRAADPAGLRPGSRLATPGRPGRRTAGAEVGGPGPRRPARTTDPRRRSLSCATVASAGPPARAVRSCPRDLVEHVRQRLDRRVGDDVGVGAVGFGPRVASSSGQTGRRSSRSPTTSTPDCADPLQPARR